MNKKYILLNLFLGIMGICSPLGASSSSVNDMSHIQIGQELKFTNLSGDEINYYPKDDENRKNFPYNGGDILLDYHNERIMIREEDLEKAPDFSSYNENTNRICMKKNPNIISLISKRNNEFSLVIENMISELIANLQTKNKKEISNKFDKIKKLYDKFLPTGDYSNLIDQVHNLRLTEISDFFLQKPIFLFELNGKDYLLEQPNYFYDDNFTMHTPYSVGIKRTEDDDLSKAKFELTVYLINQGSFSIKKKFLLEIPFDSLKNSNPEVISLKTEQGIDLKDSYAVLNGHRHLDQHLGSDKISLSIPFPSSEFAIGAAFPSDSSGWSFFEPVANDD